MTVAPIQSLDEFHTLIAGDKVIVIDFWATWCGPCKVISPIVEKLSESFATVGFYKVDVDAQQEISQEVGIRAMPTFLAFKNGQKVREVVGANPGALQDLVKAYA